MGSTSVGIQKLPKRDGTTAWYWSASQVSRLSAGFFPRSVFLWRGKGEPRGQQLQTIEGRAAHFTLDLKDWLDDPSRKTRSKRGHVYFIRAGDNVKIGFSKDVDQRLAQLQTFFPFKLELLLSMSGSALTERQLHHRFKCSRVTGEWFRRSPEIVAFVEERRQNRVSESQGKRQNRR